MDDNRKDMFDALTRVYNRCEALDIRPRTDVLYQLAGQLTIAQCGNKNFNLGMGGGMSMTEHVQDVFVRHFVFLCEHTIDCLNANPPEKEKECSQSTPHKDKEVCNCQTSKV